MKVTILREAGHEEAMLGLSLSYNADPDRMPARAAKLAHMDGGHNKFLESMAVWLDITAPRYWWQQFAEYRVGRSNQSESTMHTLMRTSITEDMFTNDVYPEIIWLCERIRRSGDIQKLKANLPEGFLQRRQIATNYKTIRHIVAQRHDHKLPEWHVFCETMRGLEHRHFIFGGEA